MIILIIATMFGANIQKILLNDSIGYRPISQYVSNLFNRGSQLSYELLWWIHVILILTFLNYLPYSKHFHILASIPNVYFSNYKIKNNFSIEPINFENYHSEYYGVKDVYDLSWKQLLDSYSCTQCGRCTISCPAKQTGKTLDPKNLILNIKNRLKSIPKLKNSLHSNFIDNYITKEEIWDCTTCFACSYECPVMIEHLSSIINIRRYLVLTESDFPEELKTIFNNLEKYFSPYQIKVEEREKWIEELYKEPNFKKENLILLNDNPKNLDYDILFWVGCIGAIDMRNIEVTKSFAKILTLAGVKIGVLGREERCNGDLARRLGNEYLAQELIKTNIDTFKKYHVNKIVTICPHCYNVFKNEYSYFGIELEVYHHTEYIYRFFKEKKLNIIVNKELNITYHDPCYLSRYNNIYKKPRNILKLLFNFQEVKRTKDRSFCCGAGGGRMFIEEKKGKRINIERLNTLIKENTNAIATSCPFCLSMLIEAAKSTKKEINIKDISEIILEHFKLN
ncbi:MAG: (Fe-S)-binding protein [Clostridia bacterium]|nr:(Fe-S)-binding protein [Clostridia bacterium]